MKTHKIDYKKLHKINGACITGISCNLCISIKQHDNRESRCLNKYLKEKNIDITKTKLIY
jgi:hypothetical protein